MPADEFHILNCVENTSLWTVLWLANLIWDASSHWCAEHSKHWILWLCRLLLICSPGWMDWFFIHDRLCPHPSSEILLLLRFLVWAGCLHPYLVTTPDFCRQQGLRDWFLPTQSMLIAPILPKTYSTILHYCLCLAFCFCPGPHSTITTKSKSSPIKWHIYWWNEMWTYSLYYLNHIVCFVVIMINTNVLHDMTKVNTAGQKHFNRMTVFFQRDDILTLRHSCVDELLMRLIFI